MNYWRLRNLVEAEDMREDRWRVLNEHWADTPTNVFDDRALRKLANAGRPRSGDDRRLEAIETLTRETNSRMADGLDALNRLCGSLQEQINLLRAVVEGAKEDE